MRVRFSSALGLAAGPDDLVERREQLSPVIIEFFHVQQDYLEVHFVSVS